MHLTVNELPLTSKHALQKGYYRSKLFTAPKTTNPIFNAATPLFSILERLNTTPTPPPFEITYQHIEHEWRAYRSRMGTFAQTQTVTAIGEYLMSATIDELLAKTYLRISSEPPSFKAFTPSSTHEKGPESYFFNLVLFIKEHPNEYLDLIELAYYCLAAGFEGEQHLKTNGRHILDDLIQELYELIQHYRVYKPLQLFKNTPLPQQKNTQSMDSFSTNAWRAIVFGATILTLAYLGSQFILDQQARTLYHQTSRLYVER